MLRGAQLDAAIRTVISRPLRDVFYRAMLLKYGRDPLGKQRPIRRNRFNANKGSRILYLAQTLQTALAEVQAFGFPPHAVAIVPVQVDLQAVIDLHNVNTQATLQLSPVDLAINFRTARIGTTTPTQDLGECAAISGIVDGIIYESIAVPGAINLAVIEVNLSRLVSSVSVNDSANNLHDALP